LCLEICPYLASRRVFTYNVGTIRGSVSLLSFSIFFVYVRRRDVRKLDGMSQLAIVSRYERPMRKQNVFL